MLLLRKVNFFMSTRMFVKGQEHVIGFRFALVQVEG